MGSLKTRFLGTTIGSALYARFIVPHYHTYVRYDRGKEQRIELPKCELNTEFIADPFLLEQGGDVWLFFEGMRKDASNRGRNKGVIACLRRINGNWEYEGIVLEEQHHLSYPSVFNFDNHTYMIPESGGAGEVALYESVEFPRKWIKKAVLISGKYVDSSIVKQGEKYYIMTAPENQLLPPEVWESDCLGKGWMKHPLSRNMLSSPKYRRNGGAICAFDGKLFRIAQDCDSGYGKRVYRIPIIEMSPEKYSEGAPEKLAEAINWPQSELHHTYNKLVCSHGTIEVVDRHFNTFKGPWAFCASVMWFIVDGVGYLIKSVFHIK